MATLQPRAVAVADAGDAEVEPKEFHFDHVFAADAEQEAVYETSARPVVESVLQGYNGTVFAYGQTGCVQPHARFRALPLAVPLLAPAALARPTPWRACSRTSTCAASFPAWCVRRRGPARPACPPHTALSPPAQVSTVFKGVEKADVNIEFTLKVSMLEIYNERIRDLLNPSRQNLRVRHCPATRVTSRPCTRRAL